MKMIRKTISMILTGVLLLLSISTNLAYAADETVGAESGTVAKLLFTFDDGDIGNINVVAPILQAKGFSATAYVGQNIPLQPWSSGKMTDEELGRLYTEYGWDLGNHTLNHTTIGYNTDAESLATLKQEYLDNQNWLIQKGWTRGAKHASYPFGAYSNALMDVLQSIGVKTARITYGGLQTLPLIKPYELRCVDIDPKKSDVKKEIDDAVSSGSTIVLMLHGVGDTENEYTVLTSYFQSIVDYAYQYTQQSKLEVTTISKWYDSLPVGVTLNKTSLTLTTGDTETLTATVVPEYIANKAVTWSTSNSAVAAVDSSGKVTAAGVGSAVITATSVEGGKTAACSVTVNAPPVAVQSVTLDKESLKMTPERTSVLTAAVLPLDAADKTVAWTSSNASVATVDSTGLVTAVASGTSVITVATKDGNKTATCSITVEDIAGAPTSVSLDRTALTLMVGGTAAIKAAVYPVESANQAVTWTTSSSTVATVDSSGNVTAEGAGTAVITATTADGTKNAACNISVILNKPAAKLIFTFDDGDKSALSVAAPILYAKGLKGTAYVGRDIDKQDWGTGTMSASEMGQLYSYYGWDLGNHTINHYSGGYDTDEASLATLRAAYLDNQNWLISQGWTRGAYHAAYPFGAYSEQLIDILKEIGVKTCRTTWGDAQSLPVESLYKLKSFNIMTEEKLIKDEIDGTVDNNYTLILMIHGVGATANEYTVKTSIFQSVVDYASQYVQQGKLDVMSISEWYNSLSQVSVESVALDKTSTTLTSEGATERLTATISPSYATIQDITWTSSNEAVATVNEAGLVTAVGNGTATITAVTDDGGKTAACTVTVKIAVTGVTLNKTEAAISAIGGQETLIATVAPAKAANKSVTWSSSNAAAATVSAAGVVTAVGNGTATITATTVDGGKTASCAITVEVPVESLALSSTSETIMGLGNTLQLMASITPNNAAIKVVTWTSSDETIATVDGTGKVTAVGAGFVKITASAGGKTVVCNVAVIETAADKVEKFVVRLYDKVLGRTAGDEEISYYTADLLAKKKTGAEVGAGFVFSLEFTNRELSNTAYVEVLYETFMNRASDPDGMAYWITMLDNGVSRAFVFKGFVESVEYTGICDTYGIERGSYVLTEARDQNPQLTMFVYRLYDRALGRIPETQGLNYYAEEILAKRITPVQASQNFFFSDEFRNRNLSDEDYIKTLYRTFMGREFDQDGLLYHLARMEAGVSREEILLGFAGSPEFSNIIKSFGL